MGKMCAFSANDQNNTANLLSFYAIELLALTQKFLQTKGTLENVLLSMVLGCDLACSTVLPYY